MQYFENKSLKKLTSLKIGGKVKKFFIAENILELQKILKSTNNSEKSKIRILGKGTNILICDDNDRVLDLIVIKLAGDFENIEIDRNFVDGKQFCNVKCGAATQLQQIIVRLISENILGLEILAGIPGTIGGAIFGNAGTKYGDISKFVKKIVAMNFYGEMEFFEFSTTKQKKENFFGYRTANFLENKIICYAELENFLNEDKQMEKLKNLENYKNLFKEKIKSQPYYENSVGCVFKNTGSFSTGKIIDELGLKGFRVGNVCVSEKHANFLVAEENASFKDFMDLMEFIKEKVKKEKKINLELEIKIWS